MMDNYYKRMIYPFAVNMVESFIDINGSSKRINISDFSQSDISSFAAVLLGENPDELSEIVWDDSVYTLAIAALKTEDSEEKEVWAEKTIVNIIKFFSPKMQDILEEIHTSIVSDFYESVGKKYSVDHQTGEGSWN